MCADTLYVDRSGETSLCFSHIPTPSEIRHLLETAIPRGKIEKYILHNKLVRRWTRRLPAEDVTFVVEYLRLQRAAHRLLMKIGRESITLHRRKTHSIVSVITPEIRAKMILRYNNLQERLQDNLDEFERRRVIVDEYYSSRPTSRIDGEDSLQQDGGPYENEIADFLTSSPLPVLKEGLLYVRNVFLIPSIPKHSGELDGLIVRESTGEVLMIIEAKMHDDQISSHAQKLCNARDQLLLGGMRAKDHPNFVFTEKTRLMYVYRTRSPKGYLATLIIAQELCRRKNSFEELIATTDEEILKTSQRVLRKFPQTHPPDVPSVWFHPDESRDELARIVGEL